MNRPAAISESDSVRDAGTGVIRRIVEVGRHGAFVEDASGGRRDEASGDPAATSRPVGDDGELVAVAVVDLDADPCDRPVVLVEGDQSGPVERREPLGKVVVLVFEPHAEVVDVGIGSGGRAEHARTERGRSDAEDRPEFVAECKRNGMWPLSAGNRIHVVPPCNTPDDLARDGLAVLDAALSVADDAMS